MTTVLDAGAVTRLARDQAALIVLRRRGQWPPLVPSIVLTECLTGDHRRDHHENRLLRTCVIAPVDEQLSRQAATLRTKVIGRRVPSAADAVVVALADSRGGAFVLTTDRDDLRRLAAHATNRVIIG
jgi:predicted nucleic acid-binding protein